MDVNHPLKNLNAIGDGGYVATNNSAAAAEMRKLAIMVSLTELLLSVGVLSRGYSGRRPVVSVDQTRRRYSKAP